MNDYRIAVVGDWNLILLDALDTTGTTGICTQKNDGKPLSKKPNG